MLAAHEGDEELVFGAGHGIDGLHGPARRRAFTRRQRATIAYEVDRAQYIAVAAGGNPLFGFRQGDALLVFALPR